jgi:MGT family glycosyltransferase
MLSVAKELIQRGHDVHWYTGKAFQAKIESIGAVFEPMQIAFDHGGIGVEEAFPQLQGLTGLRAFIEAWKAIFIGAAPKQMQDILIILKNFPADILVCDETNFGMGLAHEKSGIPLAWISTSIYFFRSKDTAPIGLGLLPDASPVGRIRNWLLDIFADHILLRELKIFADNMRATVGLPKIKKNVLQNITLPPELYLMGTVPSFEYPRSDLDPGTHFVGPFVGPPPEHFEPPTWWDDLKKARAVVHVTEGTVNFQSNRLLASVIKAMAAEEDVLVVATTGGTPVGQFDLHPLPKNVRIEPFLPHYHLLPYVDVMVTNGGYGGVQMALANGVPLVVAGATEEKPEVAAHVEFAGVGINLKTLKPTEHQLQRAIHDVLNNPRYTQRAQELQQEYSLHNGPQKAAELIERFIQSNHLL